ncbi:hypothetical protein MAN88_30190 [Microcystis aeruginosa]|nr:hypothetical protein MAN88_30190 [Microcystis aeruginosa]
MIVLEMKAVVKPSQCSAIDEAIRGSSVCVMQWTGVIRDGTLI